MEEWSVAGSGSEEDEESATNCLDFGGIKIPPHRLLHLMQASACTYKCEMVEIRACN